MSDYKVIVKEVKSVIWRDVEKAAQSFRQSRAGAEADLLLQDADPTPRSSDGDN